MKAIYSGQVLVLVFKDAAEARCHGANLAAMQDGNRFYAIGPGDVGAGKLAAALADAKIQDETWGQASLRLASTQIREGLGDE